MNFFKTHPVFSVLLTLFLLAFVAGAVFVFQFSQQVDEAKTQMERAEGALRTALYGEPAPTEASIEAAEQNIANLRAALAAQVEATKGADPGLIGSTPPASGTELLFQLEAYKNDLLRIAKRTAPLNVPDNLIKEARKQGGEVPSVGVPEDFAFGFERYLDSGQPPADKNVPVVYQQKEILNFVLRKLLDSRPISIVSVEREPVELDLPPLPEPGRQNRRGSRNQPQANLADDEFRVGAETARVEGAVATLPFRIAFSGYTKNLRSFLKEIEKFELPIVVRSVEVSSVESSVRTTQNTSGELSLFDFDSDAGAAAQDEDSGKQPIVEENESEFTVVFEFIEVTFDEEAANEEDLS